MQKDKTKKRAHDEDTKTEQKSGTASTFEKKISFVGSGKK